MDESWRTQQMRQSVVAKLNDAILASPGANNKSAVDMESHVFQKAKTKDQYLGFVARLILHVREMLPNKQAQSSGDGNPDPINALQNLANQGSRPANVMGGSGGGVGGSGGGMVSQGVVGNNPNMQQQNLMQARNQPGMNNPQQLQQQGQVGQPGPAQMQAMQQQQQNRGPMQGNMMGGGMNPQGMMNPMGGPGQGQMMPQQVPGGVGGVSMNQLQQQQQMGGGLQQMNQMGMNANVVMNQMGGQGMVNMGGGVGGPVGMAGGQMGMNPMGGGQVGGGVNPGMNSGPGGGVPMNPNMVGGPGAGPGVMNQMQNSPAGGGGVAAVAGGGGGNQMNMMSQMGMGRKPEMMMNSPGNMFTSTVRSVTPNQFLRENPSPSVPSPANIGNPSNQMIPSPAMAQSPSPQMMNVNQRNMANVMAPSPGAVSLNTPGQPGTIPSPMNPQEDQLYKEKYRQLVKYIEPLKRMTAKMMHEKNTKAIHKVNTLLEILSNSNQRIPLETLIKCEKALEQMNVFTPMGAGSGTAKEGSTCNPLIEAVTANLQSPIRNHTLQRTFKPCLEALFGSDLTDMPTPAKQARMSQEHRPPGSAMPTQQEIPHILQGEIARLDQKFKITLDSSCQTGNKTIKLICCLDDKYLPCVPPVSVTIPEEYPMVAPSCNMTKHEYNATPFLTSVQVAFTARVSKLPRIFSLTHLLDTWEMSVRQACSPKKLNETTQCQLSVMLGV